MDASRCTIVLGLVSQPAEEGQHGIIPTQTETLWMPLYTKKALVLRGFYGFDDAVRRRGRYTEMGAGIAHSLMMEGIDIQDLIAHDATQQGTLCRLHRM